MDIFILGIGSVKTTYNFWNSSRFLIGCADADANSLLFTVTKNADDYYIDSKFTTWTCLKIDTEKLEILENV